MGEIAVKANRIFVLVLCWILVVQVAVGSALPARLWAEDPKPAAPEQSLVDRIISEGLDDKVVIEGRVRVEADIAELEAARETDLPSRYTDAFHLTQQTLEVPSDNARYDLSSMRIGLPEMSPDFEKEVSVEVDREAKTIAIVAKRGGKVLGKHVLKFDVLAFAKDKEMLQFVDSKGKIYVLDMIFARKAAFKVPLPVFEVAQLPASALGKPLQASFATRGLKPHDVVAVDAIVPMDVKSKSVYSAGDFVVISERANGTRELVGDYNRGVSQMQMHTGNAVVSILASMVAPQDDKNISREAMSNLADPLIEAKAKETAGELDPITREAFAAFPQDSVAQMLKRSRSNAQRADAQRDKYSYDDWFSDFQQIQGRAQKELDAIADVKKAKAAERAADIRAQIESGDLGAEWQAYAKDAVASTMPKPSMFYRVMTHKAMKTLAVIAAGTAFTAGFLSLADGHGPIWAVEYASRLYQHYWPAVLKDATYRITLLKSSLALSAFMPALWVAGSLYGGAKGWNFKRTLATAGIRIYAALQLPFLARIAKAARQPNFIAALRLGLNPFMKVSKNSALGKELLLTEDVRPGIVTGAGVERGREMKFKNAVLTQVAIQKNRARAYSLLLAALVVGEKNGIDPATMLLAQSGKLDNASVNEVLSQEKFRQEWMKAAREIALTVQDMKAGKAIDFSNSTPEELEADIDAAKATVKRMQDRGLTESALAELKVRWRSFGDRAAKAIGNFGHEEWVFLHEVEPGEFIQNSQWKQFIIDYGLSVGQMAVIGGRADLSDPKDLAASEKGFLWTNPAHFGDMGEQVAIYGISVPAGMAQMYQKDAEPAESLYDPIERITHEGNIRPDSLVRGMGAWVKAIFNLKEANYGFYFYKGLMRKMRSIQASFVMSFLSRVLLAHQEVNQALSAFVFVTIWGNWSYGWLWQPVNRGNQIYEEKFEVLNEMFLQAKSKLGQALRINDAAQRDQGYTQLAKLYERHYNEATPEQLQNDLNKIERFLDIAPESRIKIEAGFSEAIAPIAMLMNIPMKGKNEADIQKGYDILRRSYGVEMEPQLRELNARSMLELALKYPPFRNKAHPLVTWFATTLGSVATTYYATALYVSSYDPKHMTLKTISDFAVTSGALYAGTYFGQKAINAISERVRYIREYNKAAAEGKTEVPAPRIPTYEEFYRDYIEAKATRFNLGPDEVAQILEKTRTELKTEYKAMLEREGCQQTLDPTRKLSVKQMLKVMLQGPAGAVR